MPRVWFNLNASPIERADNLFVVAILASPRDVPKTAFIVRVAVYDHLPGRDIIGERQLDLLTAAGKEKEMMATRTMPPRIVH
jgi:hypothetical protein